jgi:hypothetical protein
MGYKNVCINCKRVESLGTNFTDFRTRTCPECKEQMYFVNHKFRPPKKSNEKSWAIVKFLIVGEYDFRSTYLSYPENLKEAEEFIEKWRMY